MKPEFLYRHRWQPNDMVFWDNRSVMHLATAFPETMRRRLNRTTPARERRPDRLKSYE